MPRVGDGTGQGKGPPTVDGDKLLDAGPNKPSKSGSAVEKTGGHPAPVKGGKKK
ncbi:hypothetical protein LCGC14_1695100 [marine sediment metagenome]|uniref:Uncharacterized protein n=1 Tax=marine sediment metagenome TaxID=412755 RepID=A0A0F9KJT6_9ZZZZ